MLIWSDPNQHTNQQIRNQQTTNPKSQTIPQIHPNPQIRSHLRSYQTVSKNYFKF